MTYSVQRQRTSTTHERERTGIHARLADITHGRALDHVPHRKALDRLVFCHASRAVGAAHESNVAAPFLVAPAVSSFLGLLSAPSAMPSSPHRSSPIVAMRPKHANGAVDVSETGLTMLQCPVCLDGSRSSSLPRYLLQFHPPVSSGSVHTVPCIACPEFRIVCLVQDIFKTQSPPRSRPSGRCTVVSTQPAPPHS